MARPAGSPPSAPSPRTSWVRGHLALTGLVAALAVAVAVAVTVVITTSGGGDSPAAAPGHPLSSTAPAPQPLVTPSGAKWLTGPAGKLLATVGTDVGTLSTAERAGHHHAAILAGRKLAGDARAAIKGPMPPVGARDYRAALAALQRAGAYAANGEAGKAAPLLQLGGLHITRVTAALAASGGP